MIYMEPENIKKQQQRLEQIYKNYLQKLESLLNERKHIITDFVHALDAKKIQAIKKVLGL